MHNQSVLAVLSQFNHDFGTDFTPTDLTALDPTLQINLIEKDHAIVVHSHSPYECVYFKNVNGLWGLARIDSFLQL